jgi:uncharacterized protein
MSRAWRVAGWSVVVTACLFLLGFARRQELLAHAAARGNLPVMRIMLALGADPRAHGSAGYPLGAAVWGRHVDAIDLLLSRGVDVDTPDPSGSTPLMAAARIGDPELLRFLLDHGANLGAVSSCGNALDVAVANHREDAAALLKARGAVASH